MTNIIIKGNKLDFIELATNLGIIFNGRLTWSNYINVVIGRVYGMLRNLSKTYPISILLYEFEFFTNYYTDDRNKLNLAYNNIGRYAFIKVLRDHISQFSYRIFDIKCIIFLDKIITLKQIAYLFSRIIFARRISWRSPKITASTDIARSSCELSWDWDNFRH